MASINFSTFRPPSGILNFDKVVVGARPIAPPRLLYQNSKFQTADGRRRIVWICFSYKISSFNSDLSTLKMAPMTFWFLLQLCYFFIGVCVQYFAKLDNSVSGCSQKCLLEYAVRPPSSSSSAGNSDRNVSVRMSVRLSVRLSVTRRYCVKTKKASVMISSPSGSPKTLVFWRQISSPNSKAFPPNGGLKQGSVGKMQRFF